MTKPMFLIVLATSMLGAAEQPKSRIVKGDTAKFQGSWRVVSGESKGKPAPEDALKDLKWVIKGNRITVKGSEGKQSELTFKLDPSQKPKAIDITNAERKEIVQGIYQLEGKTLKLCVGVPGEKRPAGFVTKESLDVALFVLEREK
jgi:uncharacterized protein (TIGR03067 family)